MFNEVIEFRSYTCVAVTSIRLVQGCVWQHHVLINNIMVPYNNAALVSFLFSIFLLLCCFIGYLHPYKIMMYYTAGENGHNKKGYNDPFLWRLNIWASNKI